jgi:hypothetical protein
MQSHNPLRAARRWAGLMAILSVAGAGALGTVTTAAAQAKAPAQLTFLSVQQLSHPFAAGIWILDIDTTTTGKAIGADTLICLNASPACTVTVDLAGGDIFLSAKTSKAGITASLLGGTGEYQGATGTVVAKDTSKTVTKVTVHFT